MGFVYISGNVVRRGFTFFVNARYGVTRPVVLYQWTTELLPAKIVKWLAYLSLDRKVEGSNPNRVKSKTLKLLWDHATYLSWWSCFNRK